MYVHMYVCMYVCMYVQRSQSIFDMIYFVPPKLAILPTLDEGTALSLACDVSYMLEIHYVAVPVGCYHGNLEFMLPCNTNV